MNWNIGITLSWGAFLAGISQMGLVYFAVRSLGIKLTLQLPKLTPDIKKTIYISCPSNFNRWCSSNKLVGWAPSRQLF